MKFETMTAVSAMKSTRGVTPSPSRGSDEGSSETGPLNTVSERQPACEQQENVPGEGSVPARAALL
jgi:hypothetical protein